MTYTPDDISPISSGAASCSGLALVSVRLMLGYAGDRSGPTTASSVLGGSPPIMGGFLSNIVRDRRRSAPGRSS